MFGISKIIIRNAIMLVEYLLVIVLFFYFINIWNKNEEDA